MSHLPVLALCLIVALAALGGAARALFASKQHSYIGILSGHAAQHPLEQYLGSRRYATAVVFSTATSPGAAQEGWSLIHRTGRARRDVRLAAR